MSEEPDFQNLTDLRGALRSEDEETLQSAYESVFDAGTKPSEVLASDPPVEQLREHGVIPPEEESGPPASQDRQEMLKLLREIRDAVQGGGS